MNLHLPVNCVIAEFGSELPEGAEEEMKTFNEDILCSHGAHTSLSHVLLFGSPAECCLAKYSYPASRRFSSHLICIFHRRQVTRSPVCVEQPGKRREQSFCFNSNTFFLNVLSLLASQTRCVLSHGTKPAA